MKRVLAIALLVSAVSVPLSLSQIATGSISGSVTDATGSAIAGVEIRATSQGSGQGFSAVSSDVGSFFIPSLVPGPYSVKASLPAFKTFVATDVKVDVGETYSLVMPLEIGDMQDEITVSAGTDIVNTTEAQISNAIDKKGDYN